MTLSHGRGSLKGPGPWFMWERVQTEVPEGVHRFDNPQGDGESRREEGGGVWGEGSGV